MEEKCNVDSCRELDSWVELCRVNIDDCSNEFWWEFFAKWVDFTLYDQIYKIQINKMSIDGVLIEHSSNLKGLNLQQLKQLRNGLDMPEKIEYWRTLFPRDYLRKATVDDHVVHLIGKNRCEFFPVILNNDPSLLPRFYIQSRAFAFQLHRAAVPLNAAELEHKKSGTICSVAFEVVPFESPEYHMPEKLVNVASFYFSVLEKWNKSFKNGGYKKRVLHDNVVPLDHYTTNYRRLKETYGYWVKIWSESTDPAKYVFEDIGVASFLISLWQMSGQKPSFVDLGCGNGFLVYLLTMEGYQGMGIDISSRKIWSQYPSNIKLFQKSIDVINDSFEEDWIIANHPDELTPWIPYIASKNNKSFFILPCCEWNFDRKFDKGKSSSRYLSYLEYIKQLITISGYVPETEHLRIPSTRNISFVGYKRSVDLSNDVQMLEIQTKQQECLEAAKFKQFIPRDPTKTRRNKH